MTAHPLIVTLALDPAAQARLDQLRERHFPPERNFIPAHITLFHALDGTRAAEITADMHALAPAPFTVTASSLRSLGHGVAVTITSDALITLRAALARHWASMLTPQDRQRFQPHVTIQNKVPAAEARALLAAWQPVFAPWTLTATGLSLWRYLGGPWAPAATVPFPLQ